MFLPLSLVFMTLNLSCGQFEIPQQHIMAPHDLGAIKLHYNNGGYKGFYVENGDRSQKIQNCWLDPQLRKIDKQKLTAFLGKGYLEIKKLDNKEYTLKAKVRGLGGGPTTAYLVYCATKALCYGTAAAATTAAIVTTGGAAAGAIATAAGAGATTTATVVAGGTAVAELDATVATASASTGAAVVTTAIGSTSVATVLGTTTAVTTAAATEATVATVASCGGLAAATAFVETASLVAGALFAGPWCP